MGRSLDADDRRPGEAAARGEVGRLLLLGEGADKASTTTPTRSSTGATTSSWPTTPNSEAATAATTKTTNSSATDNPSKSAPGEKAMKRWHLPTLESSSDKRTEPRARRRRAARPVGRHAKASRAVLLTRVPARRTRPAQRRTPSRPPCARASSRASDLRPRRDRRLGRDRRLRARNARNVRPRRTPCGSRHSRRQATAHTRALAGGRTQLGDGGTTRSTSARKRHRRADRLATFREDDEGTLREHTHGHALPRAVTPFRQIPSVCGIFCRRPRTVASRGEIVTPSPQRDARRPRGSQPQLGAGAPARR